ncbi:MAG: D-Ala-D-Ala carboxypeptidase family metallohydrolase [Magnetococcus sp. YQC-5]
MVPAFMEKLETLRLAFGKPMPVSSGYRCPMHNAQASHTGLSGPHITGKAVDIQVSGADAYHLLALALSHGFTGIGLSQRGEHSSRFLHLDMIEPGPGRPRPAAWTY